jgi:hypothetical protein
MYNATANNDYDSYPSPEEYKKMMDRTGQLNYAYAGGGDTKGIPMRGQKPIFASDLNNKKWITGNEANKTQYSGNIKSGFISSLGSYQNLNYNNKFNSNTNYIDEGSRTGRTFNNTDRMFYQKQKSVSPFQRNLIMRSTNPNGTHSPENYQQTIKPRIASQILA